MGALGIFYIIFLILFYIIIRLVCRPQAESESEDQSTQNTQNQHSTRPNHSASTGPTESNQIFRSESDLEFINYLRQQNVSNTPTTTRPHYSPQVPSAPQPVNNLQDQSDSPPCYEEAMKQLPHLHNLNK